MERITVHDSLRRQEGRTQGGKVRQNKGAKEERRKGEIGR